MQNTFYLQTNIFNSTHQYNINSMPNMLQNNNFLANMQPNNMQSSISDFYMDSGLNQDFMGQQQGQKGFNPGFPKQDQQQRFPQGPGFGPNKHNNKFEHNARGKYKKQNQYRSYEEKIVNWPKGFY